MKLPVIQIIFQKKKDTSSICTLALSSPLCTQALECACRSSSCISNQTHPLCLCLARLQSCRALLWRFASVFAASELDSWFLHRWTPRSEWKHLSSHCDWGLCLCGYVCEGMTGERLGEKFSSHLKRESVQAENENVRKKFNVKKDLLCNRVFFVICLSSTQWAVSTW